MNYWEIRNKAHKAKAAARKRKQTRLGLLLGALLATTGAGIKHSRNLSARANAAANFRKGLHSAGTHHIVLPGNHTVTRPVYQAANNGYYYIHTGNGTGNIAGYTRVTKNLHAVPAHSNWFKVAKK
jgi:hypothetical protein